MGYPEGDADAQLVGSADVRIDEAGNNEFTPDSVTFYIKDLANGLYRVKVKAHNPLLDAGVPSAYSDIIGTGAEQQLGRGGWCTGGHVDGHDRGAVDKQHALHGPQSALQWRGWPGVVLLLAADSGAHLPIPQAPLAHMPLRL